MGDSMTSVEVEVDYVAAVNGEITFANTTPTCSVLTARKTTWMIKKVDPRLHVVEMGKIALIKHESGKSQLLLFC